MAMTHGFSNMMMFLGRVCLSMIFIIAGVSKIAQYPETMAHMMHEGVPYTEMMLIFAIVVEVLAGLMLLVGFKTRFAAFLLFVFIIPVTFFYHDFWLFEGERATNEIYHFLKNFTIMGGMLYVMAVGPGRWSIDKG